MTPERLSTCLAIIRWRAETLAEAADVPSATAMAWLSGHEPVPKRLAAWLEALCFLHEAAENTKPPMAGEGFDRGPPLEHVPVYAYHLLRSLGQGPVALRSLLGTDDEAAVFFLISRGLAARSGADLTITSEGRAVGEVSGA